MIRVFVVEVFILPVLMLMPPVAIGENRPNILFIAVDDLRPSIGCYGDTQISNVFLSILHSMGIEEERFADSVKTGVREVFTKA